MFGKKKEQAGSDGKAGKRRKKGGGKSSGGSHAPLTPGQEAAARKAAKDAKATEEQRLMDQADKFHQQQADRRAR
jgi:hypothetical protein